MSTKIFRGCKLLAGSFADLSKKIADFKRRVRRLAERDITQLSAEMASWDLDRAAIKSPLLALSTDEAKNLRNPLSTTVNSIMDHYKKIYETMLRDPEYDFDFHLFIYARGREFFCIPECERVSMNRMWRRLPWVREYGYWNSEDKPDEVSERQWSKRETDWNEALENPAFQVECLGRYGLPYPDVARVVRAVPSLEARSSKLARSILINQKLHNLPGETEDDKLHAAMRLLREAEAWLKTPEGQKAHQDEAARIQGLIKPSYTEADLLGR